LRNFLYVAYRELRSLEQLLKQRIRDLARARGLPTPSGPLPYVPLANMQGIDIERTAVMIARVTLWMGHRQMIERYGEAEDPLPLVTLAGIRWATPCESRGRRPTALLRTRRFWAPAT